MPGQLHCKYFEKHFCKLLPYTAPQPSSKWNEAEPGCVLRVRLQKSVRIKFVLVGEDVCHVVSITDTVDNIPALGNLVALQKMMKAPGLTNWNLTFNNKKAVTDNRRNYELKKKSVRRETGQTDLQTTETRVHLGQDNDIKSVRNVSQCTEKPRGDLKPQQKERGGGSGKRTFNLHLIQKS